MRISLLFPDYLVNRKTKHSWNSFNFSFFTVDIDVDHRLVLSPILSALFIAPVLYIFEKRIKNIKIPVSLLLFVDDGLFIS